MSMYVQTWQVDHHLALVVWLGVEQPAPGADLVGGAAAREVAQVEVGGVLVQGRHAASCRGYYQLLIKAWPKVRVRAIG